MLLRGAAGRSDRICNELAAVIPIASWEASRTGRVQDDEGYCWELFQLAGRRAHDRLCKVCAIQFA